MSLAANVLRQHIRVANAELGEADRPFPEDDVVYRRMRSTLTLAEQTLPADGELVGPAEQAVVWKLLAEALQPLREMGVLLHTPDGPGRPVLHAEWHLVGALLRLEEARSDAAQPGRSHLHLTSCSPEGTGNARRLATGATSQRRWTELGLSAIGLALLAVAWVACGAASAAAVGVIALPLVGGLNWRG